MSFVQDQAVYIKSIQSFLIQEQDTLSSLTGVSLVISVFEVTFSGNLYTKNLEGLGVISVNVQDCVKLGICCF